MMVMVMVCGRKVSAICSVFLGSGSTLDSHGLPYVQGRYLTQFCQSMKGQ